MEKKAIIKYVRSSPKKLRFLVDDLKGKRATDVMNRLDLSAKKGAELLSAAVKSARALFDKTLADEVMIKNILINKGNNFKRWRPGSKGMAHKYEKRTAHIEVVVEIADKK